MTRRTGPHPKDPFLGSTVDGWRIEGPLGQGAMGSVYAAKKGQQRAAVKVIRPDATDQENLARFRREAKLLQRVDHPNVVRCHGTGDLDRCVYLVLELLEGGSLQEVIDERGKLSAPEATGVLRAALAGLGALHAAGIVHRDIKPSNVLLDRDGKVKLADLGLARPSEASADLTATGTILGTPYYMAPELIRGGDPQPSNDLYACGALLWAMLVGDPPYPGKNPLHVLQAHLKEPVPDLRARLPGVAERLAAALERLLAKEPRDRPKDAQAALKLLEGLPAAPLARPKRRPTGSAVRVTVDGTTRAEAPPHPSTRTQPAPIPVPETIKRGPSAPLPPVPRSWWADALALLLVLLVGLQGLDRLARLHAGKDLVGDLAAALRAPAAATDLLGTAAHGALRVCDAILARRPLVDELEPALLLLLGLVLVERLLAVFVLRVGLCERLILAVRCRRLLVKGEVHQAALVLEVLGHRHAAGRLLLRRNMPALAADMFAIGGYPSAAADALMKVPPPPPGTGAHKRPAPGTGGNRAPGTGPHRLERSGQRNLERSSEQANAARILLEAGRVDDAVALLRQAGRRFEAADALEAHGRVPEAIAELEAAWREGGDGKDYWHHTGRKGRVEEARGRLAERLAHLHERTGGNAKAAAWLERAGQHDQALRVHEALGDQRAVARCLLAGIPPEGDLTQPQRERLERAARSLREAGDPAAAVDLFLRAERLAEAAETCRLLGDLSKASALFERGGDPVEAAACAEASGDSLRAAELLDEAEQYARASILYEKGGHLDEAAEAARRADDRPREAKLRERNGDAVGAAEAWMAIGRGDDALRALSKVEEASPDWSQARILVGEVHHRAGRHAEAVAAYAEGLAEAVLFQEDVAPQLHYAESLEAQGAFDRALAVLKRLEGKDHTPMDLNQRKARVEQKRAGAGKTPPPAQRPPSPGGESQTKAAPQTGAHRAAGPGGGAARIVTPNELIGTNLERYEVLRYIGEGSFAWVFEARHTTLGREAAVKVLKPGLAMGEAPRRFLREGRAVAGLKHPHLIEIYDGGDVDGLYYLALEFVKGPTLRKLIADEAPFPIARAARIAAGILSGVGAAHKKNIVHRDLKPANVLVGPGMQAKVLDFGLARVFDDAGQSATAGYLGTPRYASPEQARGQEVGEAADQYSAGLVLYEMLTGKMPFESKTSLGFLNLHAHEPPRPIGDVRADVPPGLAEAVMRALEKAPKDRHESVGAFERAVAQFIGPPKGRGQPATGRRPKP